VALGAGGCGSSSESATINTGGTVIVAPTPVTPGRTLNGAWQGTLKGTQDVLYLTLSQTGTAVEGEGAVFSNNQPTALDVSGTITPEGQAVLDLVAHDQDANEGGMELDLSVTSPSQAEGNVNNSTVPAGLDVALSRSLSPAPKLWNDQLRPNETEGYRVEARGGSGTFTLDVTLQGQEGFEFGGRWTLAANSAPMLLGAREGVVRAGNVEAGSAWSYMTFYDSEGQASFGTIWFLRMSDGIANSQSAIRATSRLNGQEVLGSVTLRQP